MAPPAFSFCCSAPSFGAQVNTSSTSFPCEASSRFSFGTTDTSAPLATLFGATPTTSNVEFMFGAQSSTSSTFHFRTVTDTTTTSTAEFKFGSGIATTRAATFGFGTATATTTNANAGFCFGNKAANTNPGFSFRPLQRERMFATFGQSNANTSCGFTFSTADSAASAFGFRDLLESNNFGRFCGATTTTAPILFNTYTPTSSSAISASTGFANTTSVPSLKFGVTTSSVPSAAAFANVASGFSTEAHQPSEIRLEDYTSNRKGGTSTTGSIKNCAPNLTFFSPTQFPLGSTGIVNSTFGSTDLFGQIPENQTTNITLAHSNSGITANFPKQTENISKSISGNPKLRSFLNSSSVSRTLIAILSQHLGMLEANTGRSFALDSLIALMIVSKMISIQEILSMIPGNIGVDDLKTHLICATKEFNSQVLSEIFEEEAEEACGKIKQEQDISHDAAHLAGRTMPLRLSLAKKLPADADTSSKVFHIQVRLPSGEIMSRSFMSDTPLSVLFACIASQGYPVAEYSVLASSRFDFSKRKYNT